MITLHEEINGKTIQAFDQVSQHNIPDTGYCQFPLCKRISNHDGYCFHHKMYSSKPVVKKAQKGIAKVSEKRKAEQKEYVKIVAEMLAENPDCAIKETGCQTIASGLHHQRKRTPATFLDKRFLIRACSNCNLWVELHPLEAIAKGHSLSKF